MNKKILYIGGFELPDKNAAAQRVISNAKIMSELGYDIVFSGITNSELEKTKQLIFQSKQTTFKFDSIPINYPRGLKSWIRYLSSISFIRKLNEEIYKNDFTHIIAYNYPAIALLRLSTYCYKRNIQLIADVTEWYDSKGSIIFRVIKSFDTMLRMNFVHKNLNGLIVISNFLNDFYKDNKSVMIPPLVDKTDLKWENKMLISKKKQLKFIYVGSPGQGQKDRLDIVINLLNKFVNEDFELTVIGIDKKKFRAIYPLLRMHQDLERKINFLGRLPHKESLVYIKASDFSFFIRENSRVNNAGFPTKFVESISCGTPVVTNDYSDVNYYLDKFGLGFCLSNNFDSNSNHEILNKIFKLNQDDLLLMKKKCFCFEGFHYSNFKDSIEEVIK